MRTLIYDNCRLTLELSDPDAQYESEFEESVVRAFHCAYPQYRCVLFGGMFKFDGLRQRPDLALVAYDWSHWFVVEVELTSHSLESHVLPQVRALSFGDPEPDCIAALAAALGITEDRASTLLELVPRSVAVVANRFDPEWKMALQGLKAQLLVVSCYEGPNGARAYEINGSLHAVQKHLGFGQYSAVDRCLRFSAEVELPRGCIQLRDEAGAIAEWTVIEDNGVLWVSKSHGTPDIDDGVYFQVVRDYGGRLWMKRPSSPTR